MHHLQFNHWAILVSALIQWFIGALWYSPVLFAKPWMAMVFIRKDSSKKNSMIFGMIASFLGSLVTSLMLAHVAIWSGASTSDSSCGSAFSPRPSGPATSMKAARSSSTPSTPATGSCACS